MTWLFSSALLQECAKSPSLPVPVAESLAAICSDGKQFAQLNVMPTPQPFWRNDKTMDFSGHSRFGLTCAVLTESLGMAVLTCFLAAFPVRTLAWPDRGGALMETAPDSGHKWRGLLARFDLNSSMWRTAQRSLLGDSDESLETWPRSGMTRNGSAYRRENVERTISVIASGFWPTPTVCGNYNRKGASKNSGNGLATAVAMSSTKKLLEGTDAQTAKPRTWPTPTATSHKGWSPNHNRRDSDDRLDYSVERLHFTDGQQTPPKRLNPDWTEWLMGWPIFWTDTAPALQTSASTAPTGSKPSGTDRFREWQRLHSPFWPLDSVSG